MVGPYLDGFFVIAPDDMDQVGIVKIGIGTIVIMPNETGASFEKAIFPLNMILRSHVSLIAPRTRTWRPVHTPLL